MAQSQLNDALGLLRSMVDQELAPGEWFEVTQQRINQFADATMDHQWIHVDEVRAKTGPFSTTIAHGHLTLSLMMHLPQTESSLPPPLEGQKLRINYGFDRVRFPAPVPVGAFIRSQRTLKRVEMKGDMIETMYEVVVQIRGNDKPACVAHSLSRIVF